MATQIPPPLQPTAIVGLDIELAFAVEVFEVAPHGTQVLPSPVQHLHHHFRRPTRYRSLYETATAQGIARARLLVSPGVARGAGTYLAQSIKTKDAADLSAALRLINLVYLSSWNDGSVVRLPPTELVGYYVKALESVSQQVTLHVIDQRANEFTDGLGPDWLKRTTSPGEAEVIPRLLFNLGIAHLSHDDAPVSYDLLLRAADLTAKVVGDFARSGDSAEAEARQFWTQVLAKSATLACHMAAQTPDEKKYAVGHSVSELLRQVKKISDSSVRAMEDLGRAQRLGRRHPTVDGDTPRHLGVVRPISETVTHSRSIEVKPAEEFGVRSRAGACTDRLHLTIFGKTMQTPPPGLRRFVFWFAKSEFSPGTPSVSFSGHMT